MNALKIFVLAAYFFIAYLTVAGRTSEDFSPRFKRSADRPFLMASRYGRSSNTMNNNRKHLSVVPRIDKFFMSSRYGKRSAMIPLKHSYADATHILPFSENLSCSYTGYLNLYRCDQRLEVTSAAVSSQHL